MFKNKVINYKKYRRNNRKLKSNHTMKFWPIKIFKSITKYKYK